MNTEPALRTFASSASGSRTYSSRCSGAKDSERARASASEATVSIVTFSDLATRRATSADSVGSVLRRRAWLSGAMLGLGQQVGRTGMRVSGLVGDHDDLAWSRRQVDSHATRHEELRSRDVGVARPDDAVDPPDRRRAVGECCHRLSSADRVHLVEAELASDDERDVDRAGRHDCDPPHACDESRDRRHHER